MSKKSTAKKQPEPVKLIDGKYSSVFTMRLYPEDDENLKQANQLTNEKTNNGILRASMKEFLKLHANYHELIENNKKLERDYYTLKKKVENFNIAFSSLNSIISEENIQSKIKCPECGSFNTERDTDDPDYVNCNECAQMFID